MRTPRLCIEKTAMKRKTLLLTALSIIISMSYAQNEFYIKGASVTIQSGALLHVQGDFHLDEGVSTGELDNDGVIEVRGNFEIESSNVEQTSAGVASTGTVRFKNYGYTTETADQNASQRIETNGNDAIGDRAFYNVEIENDNRTLASTTDNFVDVSGGDVEIKGTLTFNNDSRLRSDVNGYSDGDSYANEVYVSNPSSGSISGASLTAGSVVKYVEGKLSRQVAGTAFYYFPVGLEPNFVGTDGMEAFRLDVNSAANQKMESYLNIAEMNLQPNHNNIFCDIGEHPGSGTEQPFTTCVGGPDGIVDFVFLDEAQSHEWVINNSGADFNYRIEVYPGTGLSSTASHANGNCGGNSYYIKYLARDGQIDGGNSPVIVPGEFPHTAGLRVCPPATSSAGNVLAGQSSFSTFRIHGATESATLLPVEIASFKAYPVNNDFIEVAWITLSELNNNFFDVERSTDLLDWEKIDEVAGHGTTSDPHNYVIQDYDVEFGVTYYYRLRQVDFDGMEEYFGPDDATLNIDGMGFVISDFIPNPTNNSSLIQVSSSTDKRLNYLFYNDLGQIIDQGTLLVQGGTVKQPLLFNELDRLGASTYFLTITDGEQSFYRTLVKLK